MDQEPSTSSSLLLQAAINHPMPFVMYVGGVMVVVVAVVKEEEEDEEEELMIKPAASIQK